MIDPISEERNVEMEMEDRGVKHNDSGLNLVIGIVCRLFKPPLFREQNKNRSKYEF